MDPEQTELFALERALTPAERKRLLSRKRNQAHGYAALPGSGPAGETCKSCKHYTIRQFSKSYRKCGLMEKHWTRGPGTDIRAGSPACSRWEAEHGA